MADYFTNFSVVLKLPDPAHQKYALALAAKAASDRFEDEPPRPDLPSSLVPVLENWDFEVEKDSEGIWLHSANGRIDAACAFILSRHGNKVLA